MKKPMKPAAKEMPKGKGKPMMVPPMAKGGKKGGKK